MKRLAIISALMLFLLSCTKEKSDEPFVPVTVEQQGELLILWGYLPAAIGDPWRYIVEVDYGTCAPPQQYSITIKPGQDMALTNDQHSCKIVTWKIVYADILRQ